MNPVMLIWNRIYSSGFIYIYTYFNVIYNNNIHNRYCMYVYRYIRIL